ncbi:MAG: bifunctional serine/threonine-protein kinase/ABC transporter substrate-binding protein [Synechococcales bacterium]|nr:bifunctional serine/threonine-protein kinase/ABC transporter substrate-binding protein [Synechococcales bacterium]
MPYCINPHCQKRHNPDAAEICLGCGTPLKWNDRYHILQPLCTHRSAVTELFTLQDIQEPQHPKILKTLTSEDPKIQFLFQREQILLMSVQHEGIPKGYDIFSVQLPSDQRLHCLVMEEIPGDNLENWIKTNGAISEKRSIDWLKQIVKILDYIHQQQFFHRDIKPSNIMLKPDGQLVLIDFGSTRAVTDTINGDRTRTVVLSFGYTAPEQIAGKAVPQSDFYALGKTMMHLLMGHATSDRSFIPANPISPSYYKLLRDLTAELVKQRPLDTKTLLRRIRYVEQEAARKRWKWLSIGFSAGLLCGGLAMIPLMRQLNWEVERDRWFSKAACDRQQKDGISCGEEALINDFVLKELLGSRAIGVTDVKQEGTAQVQQGQFQPAQQSFQQVIDQIKDPESLIYLNNAKVENNIELHRNRFKIAIVSPISKGNAVHKSVEILRGVAQAQDQAVRSGLGLQVVIVDDGNDIQKAREVARELVRRRDILAVIGHHASDMTRSALEIYDRTGLVVISPTSTSEELTTYTLKKENIFFRTVPSDRVSATMMTAFLLKQGITRQVAVFYNPDKSYSRSLAGAFKETFQTFGGEVLPDEAGRFYLSCTGMTCKRPPFQVQEALRYVTQQSAQALVVIPDASESQSNAFNDAIALIRGNNGQRWVLGGDSIASASEILELQNTDRLVLVSPWEPSQFPDSALVQFWQSPDDIYPPVAWRTYTTYNAAQAVITAFQKVPEARRNHPDIRHALRQELAALTFVAPGATGEIRFREGTGELQRPQSTIAQIIQCQGKFVFRSRDRLKC